MTLVYYGTFEHEDDHSNIYGTSSIVSINPKGPKTNLEYTNETAKQTTEV